MRVVLEGHASEAEDDLLDLMDELDPPHAAEPGRLLPSQALAELRPGDLEPRELSSLDALHLATVLAIGTDPGVLVTYDQRLGDAACQWELVVESLPGGRSLRERYLARWRVQ